MGCDSFWCRNLWWHIHLLVALYHRQRQTIGHNENPALVSFADTANTIAACKAVVTTDTSVYHLAGAMGKPTVLLLSGVPDWRGRAVDGVSVFYPSVHVIRKRNGAKYDI